MRKHVRYRYTAAFAVSTVWSTACGGGDAEPGEVYGPSRTPPSNVAGAGMGAGGPLPGQGDPGSSTAPGAVPGGSTPGDPGPASGGQPLGPRITQRIWRLTPDQLNSEVRGLFRDGAPRFDVPQAAAESGFTNIAANGVVDLGNASRFDSGARAVGAWVAEQRDATTRCAPYASDGCIDTFLGWLLPGAYRRPVSAAETAEARALFVKLDAAYDYDYAIAGVVRAVLLSPDFLYRTELGDGGTVMTQHEIANLLAFAITGRSPDPELLAAAETSDLVDPDVREAQLRRLIDRSDHAWQGFFWEWLSLETLDSQGAEVGLDPALVAQVEEEYRAFVSQIAVTQRGTLRELLSAPYTWIRPELAAHYGVAHPGGDLARVELDPMQRGGLLTQGAWLISHGKAGHDNVVRRGMNIFKQAMCNNNLAPPEGLDVNAALLALVGPDATVRETVDARSSAPSCGACHRQADPMGMIFESYASDGRWQTVYTSGLPVDNAITLDGVGDFDSAPAFSAAFAEDEVFQQCFVRRVTHYLVGIDMGSPRSAAWVQQAYDAFVEADTSLEELLVAIVRYPAFVARSPEASP